jgi:hypothetical protein
MRRYSALARGKWCVPPLSWQMSVSLKEFARVLSPITGHSIDAIYERQRELQSAGIITSPGTRGPGGGVRATPSSVALLLIALAAADGKTESVEATPRFYRLPIRDDSGLPGRSTFGADLATILGDPDRAREVECVEINRRAFASAIHYLRRGDQYVRHLFSAEPLDGSWWEFPMTVNVMLKGYAMVRLASAIRGNSGEADKGNQDQAPVTQDVTQK